MSFPFRSRTLAAIIQAIEDGYTHGEIGTLIMEAEADKWEAPGSYNKQRRLQLLFKNMREDESQDASSAALELARLVLRDGSANGRRVTWYANVKDAVASDGWEFDEDHDTLVPTIPGMAVARETSFIERTMTDLGWHTPAGHYRQAVEAFADGGWASANGQLRSTLEDFIPSVTQILTQKRPKEVQACLDQLRTCGFLLNGEYSVAKGLWTMCQSRGPHPGLSSEQESRFRLMAVTAYIRFVLERLQSYADS
jgi:hypothetical protein